jgi:L-ascorbate metabolism protein UlaG (beta-lactamase superfamily)
MKIKKFGHCCLLIEKNGLRILTDPGSYSTEQNDVNGVDVILITHEHHDHLHVESLRLILRNNPNAKVITNKTVAAILEKERISFEILEHGEHITIGGVLIEGFGKKHAVIYSSIPQTQNTGYFIGKKLFYPGDAYTDPQKHIGVLALPVAGPWVKLEDAINYAVTIKPDMCFPVHDGNMKSPGAAHRIPEQILKEKKINFSVLETGKEYQF